MAQALTLDALVQLRWNYTDSDDISTPADAFTLNLLNRLTDGNGSGEANRMFKVRSTVPKNDDDPYDLAGPLTDVFGNALTFAQIKLILVYNRAITAGENLFVGGGPTSTGGNLLTTIFSGGGDAGCRCFPSGRFLWDAPLTGAVVTGGSADILRIYNAGTAAITYDLIVVGTA